MTNGENHAVESLTAYTKAPTRMAGAFKNGKRVLGLWFQATVDGAEDLADFVAQEGQNANNDDSDQHEDQCVLNQTLAFFLSEKLSLIHI